MLLSPADLIDALAFAAHKHRDQRRKDAEASPYINHPIALARLLAVEGGIDERLPLLAALLHDTVGDTETTRDELVERFGEDVAARPPTDWPIERRREYFDWAQRVVAGLRGTDARLEALFDRAFANRP